MGRASHTRALSVWANGQRVGTWRIPARGEMELQYERSWLDLPGGRPLSLSPPVQAAWRWQSRCALLPQLFPSSVAQLRRR